MEFEKVKPATQAEAVLHHLKTRGKISPLQALREFSCLRLAAVIHRLRREGHAIETDWREQGGSRYAVYRLESSSAEE